MMKDSEKLDQGAKTIGAFFDQFGEDVAARILLEVLLEGLMNEENVFIFGEPE